MTFKEFWKGDFRKNSDTLPLIPVVFQMFRKNDESGTSGIGHVLDGVIFPCGKVSVCWDPVKPRDGAQIEGKNVNSVAVYDSMEHFRAIHIGQHPTNETELIFLT